MSNKMNIINKYKMLSNDKPMGIDVTNIDPIQLYNEVQSHSKLKEKLNRFGQIFSSLEGLKQFHAHLYLNNSEKILPFKDAIFYNELIQIQVFFEFINRVEPLDEGFPYLKKIIENKTNIKLNKIRNAISHFDWVLENEKIVFRDNNFETKVPYIEVSNFSSLVSVIAIFMTNNID